MSMVNNIAGLLGGFFLAVTGAAAMAAQAAEQAPPAAVVYTQACVAAVKALQASRGATGVAKIKSCEDPKLQVTKPAEVSGSEIHFDGRGELVQVLVKGSGGSAVFFNDQVAYLGKEEAEAGGTPRLAAARTSCRTEGLFGGTTICSNGSYGCVWRGDRLMGCGRGVR